MRIGRAGSLAESTPAYPRTPRSGYFALFAETGAGLAWDTGGMPLHAAIIVENGRDRWKTPDAKPR